MANQVIVKGLSVEDAQVNRDSLAKSVFNGLFDYLVKEINKQLLPPDNKDKDDDDDSDSEDDLDSEDEYKVCCMFCMVHVKLTE